MQQKLYERAIYPVAILSDSFNYIFTHSSIIFLRSIIAHKKSVKNTVGLVSFDPYMYHFVYQMIMNYHELANLETAEVS